MDTKRTFTTMTPTLSANTPSICLKTRGLSPICRAQNRPGRGMGRRLIATAEAAGMIGASILVAVFVLLAMVSCSNDDAYDEMPSEVKSFVAHYFPNTAVESCTVDHNEIFVKLKDGPSISFDQNQKLKMVNGNGATLPQVLLFDTLPPKLYEYIENDDALNQAYILEFSTKTVYVVLQGQALIYDNISGEIHSEIIN